MLNAVTLATLKKVIATIPHDERGAFREDDLVAVLTQHLPALFPAFDEDDIIRLADVIVEKAMEDGGTPAHGMMHFPAHEPYPYYPDQLLSDGKGYLIRLADATPQFMQHAAELAQADASVAEEEARWVSAHTAN